MGTALVPGHTDHQLIDAKCFLVEENTFREPQRLIDALIAVLFLKSRRVDSELPDQSSGFGAIRCGAIDLERSAIEQGKPPVQMKFISLCVAAEVVVILENENAGRGPNTLSKEMGRGQAADSATDHDQVVFLAELDGLPGLLEEAPSRRLCAVSKDPGWLPRRPVDRGGSYPGRFCGSGARPALAIALPGSMEAPTIMAAPFMKSRRVIVRPIPSSRSRALRLVIMQTYKKSQLASSKKESLRVGCR